jgi:hypothetical protein
MDGPGVARERARAVEELRRRLLLGWPRLLVGAMVTVTGVAAFLSSAGLLHLGVERMGVRYALAVLAGWAVLLLQIRIWLAAQRRGATRRAALRALDHADPVDVADLALGALGRAAPRWTGGGGAFQGAGASASFDPSATARAAAAAPDPGGGIDVPVDLDLEGGAWLLAAALAGLAAGGVLLAGAWVVWAAPALLAEVLFDFLVSAELYRRLRRAPRAWWESALRHTWAPAAVALVLACAAGLVLDAGFPEASSIGGVVRAVLDRAG